MDKLTSELAAWEKERNELGAKVNWQFRTKDARVKLISLYGSSPLNIKHYNRPDWAEGEIVNEYT